MCAKWSQRFPSVCHERYAMLIVVEKFADSCQHEMSCLLTVRRVLVVRVKSQSFVPTSALPPVDDETNRAT